MAEVGESLIHVPRPPWEKAMLPDGYTISEAGVRSESGEIICGRAWEAKGKYNYMIIFNLIGAPTRIRTWDLRLRRPSLYPLSYRGSVADLHRSGPH